MKITVREIVESAMLVAAAIILDLPFLKIRVGINGGSISLTMVPLFILAYRMGWIKSFFAIGIVYGFLTCIFDDWGLMYFPFDYLLAYGSISLAGLFRTKIFKNNGDLQGILWIVLTVLIGFVGRICFSTISSIIYYDFTLVPALVYNLAYLLPSFVITLMLLIILYKPLLSINRRFQLKSI